MTNKTIPSIRVSQDVYNLLTDYAEKENRSITNAANHLLIKYLIEWQDIYKHRTSSGQLDSGTDKLEPDNQS